MPEMFKNLSSFDTDEQIAKKKCINCNLTNFAILFFAIFFHLAMRKIFIETETEYKCITDIILVLIAIFSFLNFKFQKKNIFYWLNSISSLLLCINIYIFLFKIIGF